MVKYERELTNCSLSLISHPSSVKPNEAPDSDDFCLMISPMGAGHSSDPEGS